MQAIIELEARHPVLPKFPDYGICILESRHSETFAMAPSRYDFSEVMLVLEGAGWIIHGKTRHPIRHHDLMVIPRGEEYRIEDRPTSPLAVLCLCIRPRSDQGSVWAGVLPGEFSLPRNSGLSREVAMHLRAILFEQSLAREHTGAVVIAQTLLLLSKLKRRRVSGKQRPQAVTAIARVQQDVRQLAVTFHEPETNEAAAARLGMSTKSLTAYFRKLTGCSRPQYLQSLRIGHACRLLRESSESVASISFACGFEDLSTFSRAFRAEQKMSPTQWRAGKENFPPTR